MFQLSFYVPESHLEPVKQALFDAGAGRIGDYDSCAWQTAGQGQFRPMAGSDPHIGEQGQLTRVNEYKVEMVCENNIIENVIAALKQAHPYEEPAFSILQLRDG